MVFKSKYLLLYNFKIKKANKFKIIKVIIKIIIIILKYYL